MVLLWIQMQMVRISIDKPCFVSFRMLIWSHACYS